MAQIYKYIPHKDLSMTPAEYAKELLDKMNVIHYLKGNGLPVSMHKSQIKQCALIAVNELFLATDDFDLDTKEYWKDVKTEIEKL